MSPSVRSFVLGGSEFHLPKVKVKQHDRLPMVTEERAIRKWDALSQADREEIAAEAKEAAARIMKDWEGRR